MTPTLSPKKTIEGAIGGTIGAILLSYLYVFCLEKFLYHGVNVFTEKTYRMVFVIVLFASIFSQIGDLFASAIKRSYQMKDFGRIIPGHGGVLDRFDSILFTAPVVYIILSFV